MEEVWLLAFVLDPVKKFQVGFQENQPLALILTGKRQKLGSDSGHGW